MSKHLGFIIGIIVVAAAIVGSLLIPSPNTELPSVELPVDRMVVCPKGDPMGKTVVNIVDDIGFTVVEKAPTTPKETEEPTDDEEDNPDAEETPETGPVTQATWENPEDIIVARGSAALSGLVQYTEGRQSAAIPCAPPVTSGSWNGVLVGKGDPTLTLINVDPLGAVVDIFVYGQNGPITPGGLRNMNVASGKPQPVHLDFYDLGEEGTPVSIHIRTTKGRVFAMLRTSGPTGIEWQLPQVAADTDLIIAGLPAGTGNRTLSITNPSTTTTAVVALKIISESTTFDPLGVPVVEIPATRAISIDISNALGGQAGALRLISNLPITATVTGDGADVFGVSSSPPLGGDLAFPPLEGTLWLVNPTEETARFVMNSEDADGALDARVHEIAPGTIQGVPFLAKGTIVHLSTNSPGLRASLVPSGSSLAILPLWSGGVVSSVNAPAINPGLG